MKNYVLVVIAGICLLLTSLVGNAGTIKFTFTIPTVDTRPGFSSPDAAAKVKTVMIYNDAMQTFASSVHLGTKNVSVELDHRCLNSDDDPEFMRDQNCVINFMPDNKEAKDSQCDIVQGKSFDPVTKNPPFMSSFSVVCQESPLH